MDERQLPHHALAGPVRVGRAPPYRAEGPLVASHDAQRAFIEAAQEKFQAKRKGQSLKRQSLKQNAREAFLRGFKSERLFQQFRATGTYFCETCLREYEPYEAAVVALTVSHSMARSAGYGYEDRRWPDAGVDAPSNLQLLCWADHRKLHPGPAFGRTLEVE